MKDCKLDACKSTPGPDSDELALYEASTDNDEADLRDAYNEAIVTEWDPLA